MSHAGSGRLPERRRHNLPAELTGFVGRRKELAQLQSMLASSRLVSLTGAGGAGKTRLAVRLAYDVIDEFPDGVWLVDLAPLTAPDLVLQTVATAVVVREGPQRSVRDALLENLRHRTLLLILDNCEHVIDACAELAQTLLQGVPTLRIVVTSREALGVPGENISRVPSLSLPEETASLRPESLVDAEATRLFIERERSLHRVIAARPNRETPLTRRLEVRTSGGRNANVTFFAVCKARLIAGGRLIAPEPRLMTALRGCLIDNYVTCVPHSQYPPRPV